MIRCAGIDCGTNSIRLLVADLADDGHAVDVTREMRIVRLGQGVDQTRRLAPDALERTRVALVDYARTIDRLGAASVRMVATSATRDAENRDEFVTMVESVLGVRPEVITGDEEAALSFAGAAADLPGVAEPMLVADIGGGSTELVLGDRAGTSLRSHSMDVGCVRLTERHLRNDPPTPAQVTAAEANIADALDRAALDVPLFGPATLVGVAGTVTTIAALALGLPQYEADAIHGSRITAADVEDITERLLRANRAERAALPVMHPGRADVIAGGALVLRALVRRCGVEQVVASEHDILDGITASAVR
ncbi:MAG: Ppx/GppA family phosphatase [Actinobacteria bacterium]|nr:Ppx/GppA family phosphatase [Actinomycetota bacterium]